MLGSAEHQPPSVSCVFPGGGGRLGLDTAAGSRVSMGGG